MPTRRANPIAIALAALVLAALSAGCAGRTSDSVLLLTIDTLRADHVGAYGDAPLETPALDRLAHEGALFEYVVAPFSRTTQSLGSVMTGLHPLNHGADGLGMTLPDRVETLAERFGREGRRTAAFASNIVIKPGRGFGQGFEIFSNPRTRWKGNSATAITREAISWLERLPQDDPFFLWVHYLDPHWTYRPPAPLAARADPDWSGPFPLFDQVDSGELPKGRVVFEAPEILSEREIDHARRLYAAEVVQTDRAVAELLQHLERSGRLDRTLILATSDHGESMGDHSYWFAHGEYIYDDTLRVPWLVRDPGRVPAGTRVRGTVRLEDVAPTLLDLAGLEVPGGLDGISHAPLLRAGGAQDAPDVAAIHLADHRLVHPENPRRPVAGREGRWWSARRDGWKLIQVPQPGGGVTEELYDIVSDPREATNRIEEEAERAARLRAEIDAWRASHPPPADDARDATTTLDHEALRSLGYVN